MQPKRNTQKLQNTENTLNSKIQELEKQLQELREALARLTAEKDRLNQNNGVLAAQITTANDAAAAAKVAEAAANEKAEEAEQKAEEAEQKAKANQEAADALLSATKERDNALEQLTSLDNMYCITETNKPALSYLRNDIGQNKLKSCRLKRNDHILIQKNETIDFSLEEQKCDRRQDKSK